MNTVDAKIITCIEYAILEVLKRTDFLKLMSEKYNKRTEAVISEHIYKLYHTDTEMAFLFKDIFTLEAWEGYVAGTKKLNASFKKSLTKSVGIVMAHKDRLDVNKSGYWVRVSSKGFKIEHVDKRMYLNVMPGYMHKVVESLVKFMLRELKHFENMHPVQIMFKFPAPEAVDSHTLIRSDKLVVYYDSKSFPTNELLRDWVGTYPKYFRKNVPLFTKVERDGVAFAYEPPPAQHEYSVEHTGEMASFGSFMSLVIARYLYSWIEKYKRIPDKREIGIIADEIFHEKLVNKHRYKFW